MYVKIRGNPKYLFALMDDETRFRISQMVADHKGTSDVPPLLADGKEIAKKSLTHSSLMEQLTFTKRISRSFGLSKGLGRNT